MKKAIIIVSAVLVGILYISPPLLINYHLSQQGKPWLLNYEVHRDELIYMARAREVYDGHFPYSDSHFAQAQPTITNPLPSLIIAAFLWVAGGNSDYAYLVAIFVFSIIIFLLFYWLGKILFQSFSWALLFAYVGILTPIALRILNFDGA